jgi:hypothetical protein
MTEKETSPRDQAQKLVDRAYAKVLGAIKDVEAVEKIACAARDNDAAIAASEVIRALRVVKEMGMRHNGAMGGITILSGGT